MSTSTPKRPRITRMNEDGIMEEIPYDSLPDPVEDPYELAHYFLAPRISPRALDLASRIIHPKYYVPHGGLHSLLQKRANFVFSRLQGSARSGTYGKLKYFFEFDKDGPILKMVAPL